MVIIRYLSTPGGYTIVPSKLRENLEGDVGVPVTVMAEDEVVSEATGGGSVVADLGAEVLAREEVGGVDLVVAEKEKLWPRHSHTFSFFFPLYSSSSSSSSRPLIFFLPNFASP